MFDYLIVGAGFAGRSNGGSGLVAESWRMLSKRLCPYTGIVNFYFAAEPHFAVGSVVKIAEQRYLWRCYTDPYTGVGAEADSEKAERRVAYLCKKAAEPLARDVLAL